MSTCLLQLRVRRVLTCGILLIALLLSMAEPAPAREDCKDPPLAALKVVDTTMVGVSETIWIEVQNLEKWAEQPEHDASKFILCLNGHEFKGLRPTFRKHDLLGFSLRPSPESIDAWKTLVGQRLTKGDREEVFVSLRHPAAVVKGELSAPMRLIDWFWLKVFLTSFAGALVLFGWLAYKTDIIRESGKQPIGIDEYGQRYRKPYSLARAQMAWWFFVILASYVFIWMMTDDLSSLTTSVLALMGISAATGVSSAIADSSKRTEDERQLRALTEKKRNDEIQADLLLREIRPPTETMPTSNLGSATIDQPAVLETDRTPDMASKQAEIEVCSKEIQELRKKTEPQRSKGFLTDILSDEGGISFHRFQMFAWTIVLTTIFVSKVSSLLTMPDFDPMLLALMGISSGTYIGFKIPKQQG